jgi:hypothetical protein
MNPQKKIFESGQTILWIETENTVAFLRPVPDIVVWTPCPTSCLAQPLRFRQVRFTGPEGLLGSLAISDVDDSAHKFNEMAGRAQNRMTYDVNVPNPFVRMNYSILKFEVHLVADGFLKVFPVRRPIIWMNSLDEFFE